MLGWWRRRKAKKEAKKLKDPKYVAKKMRLVQPGDILCVESRSGIGWLISLWSRIFNGKLGNIEPEGISHVAFILNRKYVIDSNDDKYGCGVRMRPLKHYRDDRRYRVSVVRWKKPLTEIELQKQIGFLMDQINKSYDKSQIVGNIIGDLTQTSESGNILDSPDEWTCSELVCAAAKKIGRTFKKSKKSKRSIPCNQLKPLEIYNSDYVYKLIPK